MRKEGRRKLEPVTFATFAREWLATYPNAKDLKRSTREGYESIIERHLVPELGARKLAAIDVAELDRYLVRKRRAGLAPRTLPPLEPPALAVQSGGGAHAGSLESGIGGGAAAGPAPALADPDSGGDRPGRACVR